MTIQDKENKLEKIGELQNKYYMDRTLNDEQKNARGTTTFLEIDNIESDFSLFCLLDSAHDEEYLKNLIAKTYKDKIDNIISTIPKITGIDVKDIQDFNVVEVTNSNGQKSLNREPKTTEELSGVQKELFRKLNDMLESNILDSETYQILCSAASEVYEYYLSGHKLPDKYFEKPSKSK